jgi:steroid delta-isomerase-like uncharacterized protein
MIMTTLEQLARRFVLEHNQAGFEQTFAELLAPDCVFHEYLPGVPSDMDVAGFTQFIAAFRGAMPDIQDAVEDVVVGEDKVAVRWSGQGTHTGADLMGIPAHGDVVTAHGIYILRFTGEKIAEVWDNWDGLSVAQQLSAAPAP